MIEGCRKYETHTEEWLNMLLSKQTKSVIIEVKELIRKCLNCKFLQEKSCKDSQKLVKFLEYNETNGNDAL